MLCLAAARLAYFICHMADDLQSQVLELLKLGCC
jgi:hypothetical protein